MEEAKTRILLAEDEAIERIDLHELLTALGYLVVGEASDGQMAVSMARELKPDITIMDIEMPEMDGIDAARILSTEKLCPVLLLRRRVLPACRRFRDVDQGELMQPSTPPTTARHSMVATQSKRTGQRDGPSSSRTARRTLSAQRARPPGLLG